MSSRVEVNRGNGWELAKDGFKWRYGGDRFNEGASTWARKQIKKYNYDFRTLWNDKVDSVIDRPYKDKPYGIAWHTLKDLLDKLQTVKDSYIDTRYCDAYITVKSYRKQNEDNKNKERFLNKLIDTVISIDDFEGYNLGKVLHTDGTITTIIKL